MFCRIPHIRIGIRVRLQAFAFAPVTQRRCDPPQPWPRKSLHGDHLHEIQNAEPAAEACRRPPWAIRDSDRKHSRPPPAASSRRRRPSPHCGRRSSLAGSTVRCSGAISICPLAAPAGAEAAIRITPLLPDRLAAPPGCSCAKFSHCAPPRSRARRRVVINTAKRLRIMLGLRDQVAGNELRHVPHR